jgi:hypothetical protein
MCSVVRDTLVQHQHTALQWQNALLCSFEDVNQHVTLELIDNTPLTEQSHSCCAKVHTLCHAELQ